MEIRIRNDAIEIDGYVNAVERLSKPLTSRIGRFLERIKAGAFGRAIKRNPDVRMLLNHDENRELANTANGTLELREDAIGLKAHATITDADVVQKAREGRLVGWSFGFYDVAVEPGEENGMPVRNVKELDLREVSLLDDTKRPAYDGTLVEIRSEDDNMRFGEETEAEFIVRDENPQPPNAEIDYSKYETMIAEMKGAKIP
jgi:HK97 family phage prohead protease